MKSSKLQKWKKTIYMKDLNEVVVESSQFEAAFSRGVPKKISFLRINFFTLLMPGYEIYLVSRQKKVDFRNQNNFEIIPHEKIFPIFPPCGNSEFHRISLAVFWKKMIPK